MFCGGCGHLISCEGYGHLIFCGLCGYLISCAGYGHLISYVGYELLA